MCYSARIEADYRKYVREFGAEISLEDFTEIFWRRRGDSKIKIPKGMEAAFAEPHNDAEQQIKSAIDDFNTQEATRLEQELFKQRTRLADAERKLSTKSTKAATESQRIATEKIQWTTAKLADLRRTELKDRDSRIFPGHYAPVMVMEQGRLVVKPMRYLCRPAGKPAFYDTKFSGCFNARRNNLGGFWKDLFAHTHGIVAISAFYENVNRHRAEGRELGPGEEAENVILEFKPKGRHEMFVACLWSHWTGKDEPDLLSFAAITDEPPAEVAAAGHDRCLVPIKGENVMAWLNPDPANIAAQYAILDDRERPYYEHRMAA